MEGGRWFTIKTIKIKNNFWHKKECGGYGDDPCPNGKSCSGIVTKNDDFEGQRYCEEGYH